MEKIENFSKPLLSRRGNMSPYPWQRIADDGGVHRCYAGTDYKTTDRRFQMTAHAWAERHNLRAHALIPEPGVVEVQFYPREQP